MGRCWVKGVIAWKVGVGVDKSGAELHKRNVDKKS